MTSAYAPYQISYAARTPYLTNAEYNNAPTAMDTANLLAQGSSESQAIALQETINRASSWVDQFTCGTWGTLCATVEIENARVWGSYRGTLLVHPRFWPVVEVQAFSYSTLPAGLINNSAASVNPSNSIVVYPQEFEVSNAGTVSLGWSGGGGIAPRYEFTCQYQYVAGWPNTTLSASVAAGATSIQPTVLTGIYPGSLLTIYDLPDDEPVVVSASYVPGATVVPLTNALQFDHPTTATVTNMPPSIKQATILATTAFIKQRGSGALVVSDMGAQVRQQTGFSQESGSDWQQAKELLRPFKQMFVQW